MYLPRLESDCSCFCCKLVLFAAAAAAAAADGVEGVDDDDKEEVEGVVAPLGFPLEAAAGVGVDDVDVDEAVPKSDRSSEGGRCQTDEVADGVGGRGGRAAFCCSCCCCCCCCCGCSSPSSVDKASLNAASNESTVVFFSLDVIASPLVTIMTIGTSCCSDEEIGEALSKCNKSRFASSASACGGRK